MPSDPALARLFPDGYTDDAGGLGRLPPLHRAGPAVGEAAAASRPCWRRSATSRGGWSWTPEQAQAWLGALNDSRLVLGERLGVTEDLEALVESLAEDDPRLPLLWVYDRLTYLQESLVQALWADA